MSKPNKFVTRLVGPTSDVPTRKRHMAAMIGGELALICGSLFAAACSDLPVAVAALAALAGGMLMAMALCAIYNAEVRRLRERLGLDPYDGKPIEKEE